VAIWLLPGIRVGAQDPPLFSVTSELVVLHVTVKDRSGAYITNLPRGAFSVIEDGAPQTLQFVSDTDTPVTVGLLIDSSGSMHPHRERIISATEAFVEESHPEDEIFALAFNERVQPALPPGTPFTNDTRLLRRALEGSIGSRGRTALYDAIAAGLDYSRKGSRVRKALIVLSDGADNASRETLEAVLTKAQGSNTVIYTIALIDRGTRDANPKLLEDIARVTGGEAFRPGSPRRISEVLRRIARDIRHAYTIGYVPANPGRDDAFRSVRVVVTPPDGRRLVVRSRSGYAAGSPR
jgi:VWFA-related protein